MSSLCLGGGWGERGRCKRRTRSSRAHPFWPSLSSPSPDSHLLAHTHIISTLNTLFNPRPLHLHRLPHLLPQVELNGWTDTALAWPQLGPLPQLIYLFRPWSSPVARSSRRTRAPLFRPRVPSQLCRLSSCSSCSGSATRSRSPRRRSPPSPSSSWPRRSSTTTSTPEGSLA